jgi:hypothetical protein
VDTNSIVVSYPYTNYAMASSGTTVPANACVVPIRRMAASYLPESPPGGASGEGILALATGAQSVGYQFSTGPARIVHSVNGTVFSVDNNGVVTLRYGSTIREYAGTPESHVYARIGSICLDITNGSVYRKTTIETSNTGWVAM